MKGQMKHNKIDMFKNISPLSSCSGRSFSLIPSEFIFIYIKHKDWLINCAVSVA